MPAPRRSKFEQNEQTVRLQARIEDLELRVKLLEARVRALTLAPQRPSAKERRAAHRRPRCPGCMLEAPPGKRGDSCVWCGFKFDAVGS